MRSIFGQGSLALGVLLSVSSVANAGIINGALANTGLDANGAVLNARGGTDAHWFVDGASAITYKHRLYAGNDDNSSWISVNRHGGNETTSARTYTYSTTFDLTGYDASTASISGLWGADNYGSIFLNGIDTGNSLAFGYGAFRRLSEFTISDYFVSGLNTLSVQLTNGHINPRHDPGPGALRMDDLRLTAAEVPEPGSLALLAIGIAGLVLSRKVSSKNSEINRVNGR